MTARLYLVTCDTGHQLIGIPAEVHPTHRDVEIIGTWPSGRYLAECVAIPDIIPPASMFEYNPSLRSEPTAVIPRARVGARQIAYAFPPEQRTTAAGQWIVWRGKTTEGPLVASEVHMRIGHLSPLADIVAWADYSDRTSEAWELDEEFLLEFDEPVSWITRPYSQTMKSETRVVARGTMLFTIGENGDTALGATRFLPGAISVRAHASHWEGRFLLHSNIYAQNGMPTHEPIVQITHPTAPGGRRAFGVQDLTMLVDDPDVIHRTLIANDIDAYRPNHYLDPDGSPMSLDAINDQYNGAFHNSRLDWRLGRHDNFGKPLGWAPVWDAQPQDWAHMSIHVQAALWVLTSDPLVYANLRDQAVALIYGRPGYGDGPDRRIGQATCSLMLLAKIFGDSEIGTRCRAKIQDEMERVTNFRSRFPGYEKRVWPGLVGAVAGALVPNPYLDPEGRPMGWTPFQLSRYVQGLMDVQLHAPELLPERAREDAVKLAEAVILEGYTLDGENLRTYYAVTYRDGQRLNVNDDLYVDGRASPPGGVNAGYIWQHSPSVWWVLNYSEDAEALKRARRILAIMRANVQTHEQASWMSNFPK